MATDADLPIYDTPLHTPIELGDTRMSTDKLVIYAQENHRAWIQSTWYVDTYDIR